MNKQLHGQHFDVTAAAISGSAVATEAASTGRTHYVTDIAASSPVSTVIVEVIDGSTILWSNIVGSGGFIGQKLSEPIAITSGSAVTLLAGTAATIYVNLGGFTI